MVAEVTAEMIACCDGHCAERTVLSCCLGVVLGAAATRSLLQVFRPHRHWASCLHRIFSDWRNCEREIVRKKDKAAEMRP